jgi:hypothetical protein
VLYLLAEERPGSSEEESVVLSVPLASIPMMEGGSVTGMMILRAGQDTLGDRTATTLFLMSTEKREKSSSGGATEDLAIAWRHRQ